METALAIVLVLLLVFAMSSRAAPKWVRDDNVSYITTGLGLAASDVKPKGGSGDGNVEYVGTFATQAEAEAACAKLDWCNAYTWFSATDGDYAHMCYGMKNVGKRVAALGMFSATRKVAEGFSARASLDRVKNWGKGVMGEPFSSAVSVGSFDNMKENYQIGDPAKNTMWSNFHNASSLPI